MHNDPAPHHDVISIRDLEVHYTIGVTDEERARPQRLLLTLDIQSDFTPAAASDSLAETIDYDAVCRRMLRFGNDRHWQLLETLASDVAQAVLEEFHARAVTVEIKKFVIPQAREIAVRLFRQRHVAAPNS